MVISITKKSGAKCLNNLKAIIILRAKLSKINYQSSLIDCNCKYAVSEILHLDIARKLDLKYEML